MTEQERIAWIKQMLKKAPKMTREQRAEMLRQIGRFLTKLEEQDRRAA